MNQKTIRIMCLIITFILSPLYAQDTTRVTVAPGFEFYHITDPDGPFNITVLEIGMADTVNIVSTVLANDVMGEGFERTSAMSKRVSESGYVVVGAINGDFYGIREPLNPYGFLSNSMVTNGEFVYGTSFHRSLFGMVDESDPFIDVLHFSGSVVTSDGTSYSINRVNSERTADALVAYNSFFGTTTRTNQWGTEVRLRAIDTPLVGSGIRFLVTEKESGVGSMEIEAGDYILSGHGAAGTFLNGNVSTEDTLTVQFSTAPDVGSISALIGGGPRLVTNGTRPASFVGVENMSSAFVDSRHPRTAAGFNEDSSKVYFVAVDGRQSISVGMSLPELADFLIAFGVHNAVNLDGGGSTTLVVHDKVMNSPSDPGGERSVANALIAVKRVTVQAPVVPELLHPGQGAADQPDTVLLQWRSVPEAVRYRLQLSGNGLFDTVLLDEELLLDTSYVLTGIEGQTEYHWRVRAENAEGVSDYSQPQSFTTGFPGVPSVIYPEHANTEVSTTPEFVWTSAMAAEEYRVQVSRSRDFRTQFVDVDSIVVADTVMALQDELVPERLYFWRVAGRNAYGQSGWSDEAGFRTIMPPTSVSGENIIPDRYELRPNYPNPFNPTTNITFALPEREHITIQIYSVLGAKLETVVDEYYPAGVHTVEWNARERASGVYYCVMQSNANPFQVRSMVLVR